MAIRIPLGHVKDGLNEFDISANPDEIGLDKKFLPGKLDIHITIEKISSQLDLNIRLTGMMNLECDRCLEFFDRKFSNSFELVYVINEFNDKLENDDYVRPYSPHMRYIDITKDVKDFVELSVPMRRVPEEKDDGSCSWCGKSQEYWNKFIKSNNEEE